MKRRRIPLTQLEVSPVCLGTMTFGTPLAEAEAIRLVHMALDRGVNFIDTANSYEGYTRVVGSPGGVAEMIIGKALKGRRDGVVVATKVGMKVGNEPDDENASPSAIRKNLDLSLKRLAIDCIDIFYVHRPDPVTPLAETLGALDEAMRAGKIRHYAVSNYTRDQFADLLAVADSNHLPRPVAHEPELSMLKPERAADLLPFCAQEQIAVFPYRVLHGGLLTGKYALGQPPPPGSRKAERDSWLGPLDDALFARLEVIRLEAKEARQSMTEFAIRWALRQPAVLSVIIGAKRIEQLDDAIGAVN